MGVLSVGEKKIVDVLSGLRLMGCTQSQALAGIPHVPPEAQPPQRCAGDALIAGLRMVKLRIKDSVKCVCSIMCAHITRAAVFTLQRDMVTLS